MKAKFWMTLISFLLIWSNLNAQNSGDTYFNSKDYFNAARAYENEVSYSPSKYLNLAKSYFALKQYDKALNAMNLYKSKYSLADLTYANTFIQLLERNDDKVSISNVGSVINTSVDEMVPRISSDGKKLYFKAIDRSGGKGGEDIWVSTKNADGSWGTPQNITKLNTYSHEALYSISSDENVSILFGNYDGTFGNGDLFYSTKTAEGWTMPCNLGGSVNTTDWEAQATLTADGRTLLFVAQRTGGYGEYDIYVTHLTNDNGWTKPLNLGSGINTKYSEIRPSIAPDGKTLYFSSTGYFSFGGTDIYMARRLDDTWTNWSTPINLGKYINTLEDDEDFSVPASGIYGYTAKSNLPGGYGKFDIYQFILPMNLRPMEVITVFGKVTNDKDSAVGALISYYDMSNNQLVTNAVSNSSDGKYLVNLQPGKKYKVVFDMKGYIYYSEILDLTDPSTYKSNAGFQSKIGNNAVLIDILTSRLDSLNNELKNSTKSNSYEVGKSFETMGNITSQIKTTTEKIEDLYLNSKYNWLTEENKLSTIEKNYKLNRIKVGVTFELKNIFFEFGKASLKEESKTELDKLYEILAKTEIGIELGGHTDSIGSDEANMKLSQDRVNSVRDYLVAKGMATNRLTAVGYGENQPVASNTSDEGRAKNRRVEVKITSVTTNGTEGSNVVTATMDTKQKEEYENQLKLKEKEELAKVDMTALLQLSARKGGLPAGCQCNDKIIYLDTYIPPVTTVSSYKSSNDYLERDDNFLKMFSIHALNYGVKTFDLPYDATAGIGMTFVKDDESLRETSMDVYFYDATKDTTKFNYAFYFGQKWNIQLIEATSLPINIVVGYDLNAHGLEVNSLTYNHFSTGLELGTRYIGKWKSLIYAPEIFYIPTLQNSDNDKNGGLFHNYRIGGNVRYKFLQAGVFYNIGKYHQYPGFRLGVTF